MKSKLFLLISLLLLIQAVVVFAEENENTVYIIREIEFDVIGRSRPYYLILAGEFTADERIKGRENFDKYLSRKTQLLRNRRVLEEVNIDYSFGETEEDGALPVKLLVHIKDTFNFIVLPYPKYDSNDGFSLTLKGRDYNFLGTMEPLRVDLGYKLEDGHHSFNFMVDSDIPFRFKGLDFVFNFDHLFEYSYVEPLYYQNVTGLSVNLPMKYASFTTGFNQYLTINEKLDSDNPSAGYFDPYASTEIFGSWGIPLGVTVSEFGDMYYTPRISGRINYPYSKMNDDKKPVTTFSHSVGFGRINWIGNFRKGLEASVWNAVNYYFDRSDAPLKVSLEAGGTFHWPFNKIIGVSTRLKYRQWWQWSDSSKDWVPHDNSGDVLRGIINDEIHADFMLSLNLDFPIRIIRFWPSECSNNRKYRLFDFEVFFSPFLDLALLKGPYNELKDNPWEGTKFNFKDMAATTGFEIIVYPGFFRSLYIRGSLGYDINKIRRDGLPLKWKIFPQWNEIYIGVELYY